MNAVRVRADHTWFQSGCNSRLRISLSPVRLLITVRNEKPVPYFQSTSVASVISDGDRTGDEPEHRRPRLARPHDRRRGRRHHALPTTEGRQLDRTVMLAPIGCVNRGS